MKLKQFSVFLLYILGITSLNALDLNTTNYNLNCEKKECTLSFSKYISESIEYVRLTDTINHLDSSYILNIYIDGYGGYLDGGFALINSIKSSKVKLKIKLIQNATSMNAFILTYFRNNVVFINDNARILYHKPRITLEGINIFDNHATCVISNKPLDRCKKELDKRDEHIEKLIRNILNEEELIRFKNNEDVIITGKQFKERLKVKGK